MNVIQIKLKDDSIEGIFLVLQVVFLTALFYLLVPSDHRYKPAQLISLMNPGSGNTSVFHFSASPLMKPQFDYEN